MIGSMVSELKVEQGMQSMSIYDNLDYKFKCAAMFLNLSKMFNLVLHCKLMQRLKVCWFRGMGLLLFTSYLERKTQVVKIEDQYSDSKQVFVSLPHSKVLGSILFNIYINLIWK